MTYLLELDPADRDKSEVRALTERRQRLAADGAAPAVDSPDDRVTPYEILKYTALHGCGPRAYPDYMSHLLDPGRQGTEGFDTVEFFALPPLVRYVYQFPHCLDERHVRNLKKGLSVPRRLFGHGTVNHAAMQGTSLYLLAQKFSDMEWHDSESGSTFSSEEVMNLVGDRLKQMYRSFAERGSYEMFSPSYIMLNFNPMLNLIDFAIDRSLRRITQASAIAWLIGLKVTSFEGTILPPITRIREEQMNGSSLTASNAVLWYYFGLPRRGQSMPAVHSHLIPVMLSTWIPPHSVLSLAHYPENDYEVSKSIPAFSVWGESTFTELFGRMHVTKGYAIGSGAGKFDPTGYNLHNQTFGIFYRTSDEYNSVECYSPYWNSNYESGLWGFDRSSPFQETFQVANQAIMLIEIPDRDPWRYPKSNVFFARRSHNASKLLKLVKCRFPRSVDEAVVRGGTACLREGTSFVGVRVLGPDDALTSGDWSMSDDDFRIVQIHAARAMLYFEVQKMSLEEDFARYCDQLDLRRLNYDPETSTASFDATTGAKIETRYKLVELFDGWVEFVPDVSADGVPISLDQSSFYLDSGFARLGGGRIFLKAGETVLDVDLSLLDE
ncbi:MAG TPA: hypothetical protein VHL31_02420 [Geminicoccus sp.]|jgi:hypothetical protein|uniref:hypothetical protein n=1 Tax=Geminicoccus sp. TaxID=2024832 RepID=UPI002E34E0E2|nr:hypothetical protein [Geminicoccus sp.]HEX2525140.1 hypothetical protein [Geminicoccus sp.]